MFRFSFHLAFPVMVVVDRVQCTIGHVVNRIYGCCTPSKSCNRCFVSDFEQHLSVLGPCLMALDMHLRVLGQVYAGPYYRNCFLLASAVVMVSLAANSILNCTIGYPGRERFVFIK